MSRLMIDTNVLLDLISADRPSHAEAYALFAAAVARPDCRLYALASSLKDVYFVYERHYGSEESARRKVALLTELLELCACDGELVRTALKTNEPDFEDALVRCAAERMRLDGVVTRDKDGFAGSLVPKMSAVEAAALLQVSRGDE